MEPLASKIRPTDLAGFIGQEHLVGKGKPIYEALASKHLFSFILWGPPGVGKTTLARIYANGVDADLIEISAVNAGKEDLKKAVSKEDNGKPKILFIDEIHRFNKSQQDFLLQYVEKGILTLIGATTENPSFEVTSALLSRCRVFVLNELSDDELRQIIERTGYATDEESKKWLIGMANGDARRMISIIEDVARLYGEINPANLNAASQDKRLRFDKSGEEHYNTISAFIKSMRASNPDAALYYLARMIDSGEDPKFIARRMVIFASEDIGMANPTALVVANDVFRAVETIGLPECGINLGHGVVYLSVAPKSRAAHDGFKAALEDVNKYGNLPIPLVIRNAPTKLMKDLDYGKGYERYTNEDLLPDKLKGKKYYIPTKPVDKFAKKG
jgi:putative ATPase